jgi:putative ABC transport system substrate-binding protein
MPVVGFLNVYAPGDPSFTRFLAGFRRGLRETGHADGQNVRIEFRWGGGQYDRLPALAAESVRDNVAVIVAGGPPAAVAAKAATATIPIVFTSDGDAIKIGLVSSVERPGGNATGVSVLFNAAEGTRFALLRNLVPKSELIAALLNPKDPGFLDQSAQVEAAARSAGQRLLILHASADNEIDAAFETMDQQQAGGLLIGSDSYYLSRSKQIIELAERYAIPTIYSVAEFTLAGGLASYGLNIVEAYRVAGSYVGRILNGEKPGDLPVHQVTKFEFFINLKTARTLGLTIPAGVLAIVDELVE